MKFLDYTQHELNFHKSTIPNNYYFYEAKTKKPQNSWNCFSNVCQKPNSWNIHKIIVRSVRLHRTDWYDDNFIFFDKHKQISLNHWGKASPYSFVLPNIFTLKFIVILSMYVLKMVIYSKPNLFTSCRRKFWRITKNPAVTLITPSSECQSSLEYRSVLIQDSVCVFGLCWIFLAKH